MSKKLVAVKGTFHAVAIPQNPCAWYIDGSDIKSEIAGLCKAYGCNPDDDVKILETKEHSYGVTLEGCGQVLVRYTTFEAAQNAAAKHNSKDL